jgi:hypothetical protein
MNVCLQIRQVAPPRVSFAASSSARALPAHNQNLFQFMTQTEQSAGGTERNRKMTAQPPSFIAC